MRGLLIVMSLVLLAVLGCVQEGFPVTPSEPWKLPKLSQFSQEEAIRLAKAHLSLRLGIPLQEITVVSVVRIDWPDTSLGLPEPGKVYAQVIVPGFKITLRAKGQDYVYHAGWMKEKWLLIPAPKRQ